VFVDADRFDDLLRFVSASPSRRGMARALGAAALAGMFGQLVGINDLAAKKKKKKKCKASKGKKKCGKKCISLSSCCTSADCGGGATCQNGSCLCPTGQKPCQGACISQESCCVACGELGVCENGSCVCLTGGKACEGSCIPVGNCCASTDCGPNAVCANGTCSCLSGFKDCQGSCISMAVCCGGSGICGEDADGGCTCETQVGNGGGLVCHKDEPFSSVATCAECPPNTACINQGVLRCFKLCGAP
jgi:hypothetical protein